jgi:hypothetical protein
MELNAKMIRPQSEEERRTPGLGRLRRQYCVFSSLTDALEVWFYWHEKGIDFESAVAGFFRVVAWHTCGLWHE